jgi:hypothetical protein
VQCRGGRGRARIDGAGEREESAWCSGAGSAGEREHAVQEGVSTWCMKRRERERTWCRQGRESAQCKRGRVQGAGEGEGAAYKRGRVQGAGRGYKVQAGEGEGGEGKCVVQAGEREYAVQERQSTWCRQRREEGLRAREGEYVVQERERELRTRGREYVVQGREGELRADERAHGGGRSGQELEDVR